MAISYINTPSLLPTRANTLAHTLLRGRVLCKNSAARLGVHLFALLSAGKRSSCKGSDVRLGVPLLLCGRHNTACSAKG